MALEHVNRLFKKAYSINGLETSSEILRCSLPSPNGIALEASWWANDPTGQALSPGAARYSDPDPVPAARELLAAGALATLPTTRLVDAPTGDVYRVVHDRQAVHQDT